VKHNLCLVMTTVVVVAAGCKDARETYRDPPAWMYSTATYQVKASDAVVSVPGATVDRSDFFLEAGVRPLLGRFFVKEDRSQTASGVVVLSHDFWKVHFNASPAIIGTTIEVDNRSSIILGIAPPGFDFPKGTAIWVPKRD
jgi:hypothetical protein